MMDNFTSRIEDVVAKTKKILEKNSLLQKENVTLTELNESLKTSLNGKKNEIHELHERLKVLKLANSISGDEVSPERTELKRKINEYIKEVDKCIALLNE